ncbi:MAG: hypothetical protein ACFCUI_07075 [Bernardetiaceae bacterium]
MKTLFPILIFFLPLGLWGQTETTWPGPVAYNNFLAEQMNDVATSNLVYIAHSVHSEDLNLTEKKRQEVLQEIERARQIIQVKEPYTKGEAVKAESLAVLDMYREAFALDFKQINVLKTSSKETYEAMKAYLAAQDAAEDKLHKAADRFAKARQKYLKAHELTATEQQKDPLEAQIKTMGAANRYIRQVFLTYFRVFRQDINLSEALQKGEKNKLEGYRLELIKAAEQALQELGKMEGFEGDYNLLNQTTDLIRFYRDLGNQQFKDISRISQLEDSALTQADVDTFNEAVRQYNEILPAFVERFHEAQNALRRKHTPAFGVQQKKTTGS